MHKKSPIYRLAVEWIAHNDDASENDINTARHQLTVILVADVFRLDPEQVAEDVIAWRRKGL